MNGRTRLLVSVSLPLILVLIIVGVFLLQRQPATGAADTHLTTMTLALDWTPNTNHTGIYVAMAKNWYREQGIDLKILPYSSSVTPDVLVASGKADVGIGFTEGIVADAAVGQPVVSIAAIMQHNTSALVTLADSGLTRPRDLDGKKYGAFGASYETPVVSQVIKHDGGQGTFQSITLNTDAMQALESHQIDFVWVFQGAEGIQAQRQGIKLNVFPITKYGIADYYTPNIITSPREIQQKSALLHKFMQATSQGYEYARTQPDEAAQALLSQNKGAVLDAGYITASQQYVSKYYADPGQKWGLQTAAVWHNYPQFIVNAGGVADASGKPVTQLNYDALYTNQFLP